MKKIEGIDSREEVTSRVRLTKKTLIKAVVTGHRVQVRVMIGVTEVGQGVEKGENIKVEVDQRVEVEKIGQGLEIGQSIETEVDRGKEIEKVGQGVEIGQSTETEVDRGKETGTVGQEVEIGKSTKIEIGQGVETGGKIEREVGQGIVPMKVIYLGVIVKRERGGDPEVKAGIGKGIRTIGAGQEVEVMRENLEIGKIQREGVSKEVV